MDIADEIRVGAWADASEGEDGYPIAVRFIRPIRAEYRPAFEAAAVRWSRLIRPTVPPVRVDGERIDGVVVYAQILTFGDGTGGGLAQAGPEFLRPAGASADGTAFIPATGKLAVDATDVPPMLEAGTFTDVVTHELGHLLGIGSIWTHKGLLRGGGTSNPTFVGPAAMREYARLRGTDGSVPVPIANAGAAGVRECHWREMVFGAELMSTVVDDGPACPISMLTVVSLMDLGYDVHADLADPYSLPTLPELVEAGLDVPGPRHHGPEFLPTVPLVLPDDATE